MLRAAQLLSKMSLTESHPQFSQELNVLSTVFIRLGALLVHFSFFVVDVVVLGRRRVVGGGRRLLEARRLLNVSPNRMGAYSRGALI